MTRIGMAIDPDRVRKLERRRRRRDKVLAWTSGVLAVGLLATNSWYVGNRAVSTPVDEAALLAELVAGDRAEVTELAEDGSAAPEAAAGVADAPAPGAAAADQDVDDTQDPTTSAADPSAQPASSAPAPSGAGDDGQASQPATGPADASAPQDGAAPAAKAFGIPGEGVYAYRTEGYETISLGGSRHDYPERTFAIVEAKGGCEWTFDHRILEEKRARNTYCHEGAEHRPLAYDGWITFFGQTSEQHYTCEGVRARADDRDGATHNSTCVDGDARTDDRTSFLGVDRMVIGGVTVDALHYRIDTVVTGSVEGTSTQFLWLHPTDGLILRLERDTETSAYEFGAQVDYVEHAVFELESLSPRR